MNPHCVTYVIYVRARMFNLEEQKLESLGPPLVRSGDSVERRACHCSLIDSVPFNAKG